MTPLRQRMVNDMTVRGLAENTKKSYLNSVSGLAQHYGRSPEQISAQEVQEYLIFLHEERGLAWKSCNCARHGIRFFYRITLGLPEPHFYLPGAKTPSTLPELLNHDELVRLFSVTTNRKHRALLMTAYAAGLRASELGRLQISDIDSQRMCLRVDQGKGNKDRYVPLSPRLLVEMRDYWRRVRPEHWLFPGHYDHPMTRHGAASQTLLEFGRNPRWLGAELGITMVLHTWGQNLGQHIHVHCIVTDGGLSPDGQRWLTPVRKGFLFPTAALSKVFRGKYLDFLGSAHRDGELRLRSADGDDCREFECLKIALRSHHWVVYSKPPFAGAERVLAYLGRYTHRIAISNHRLVDFDGEHVRFRWRDYADGNKVKVMRLDADEFIRRFLLHVLPRGFTRLRHYGLLANRFRARKLALCRDLLGQPAPEPREPETAEEMMLRLTGIDITACQQCGEGTLRQILILEPHHRTGMATMKTGPP